MNNNVYRWSKFTWIIVFTFLLLGAMTRFYRLDWSFWGDETSTFLQVKALEDKIPPDPLAYYLQHITYQLFGRGERESRMGVAITGTLAIAFIVLLVFRLYGHVTAVLLGFILLLSPWHLFHSQNQRSYSYAFFFGAMALLTAALAWKENNGKWAALSGLMSALTVATHSLSMVIPVALGTFVIFEILRHHPTISWRAIRGYLLVGVPLLLFLCFWAWFGWQNWSERQNWGYTSIHTLMGIAFNLNWGITLTACAGWWWAMWYSKDASDRLWGVVVIIVIVVAILAPLFLPFRQDYVFASTVAFFILAARFVALMYEQVKKQSRLIALAMSMVFILLPLPSFVSHYQDGDRHDYRSAAKFINDHYQPGDIILSASWISVLRYYLPAFQVTPIPNLQEGKTAILSLEQHIADKQRVWLIYSLAREEIPQDVDQWLWKHGIRMLRIKKKRFDYHENITEVYLLNEKQEQ
ncbi:hypothetical protein U27_06393 [Candidatus Vecturithrix granuli]|uniref:Glycosyltransferase RgtA/B/C/D-like domain-containing protein n=1 Tax=Vecturithrix granuli TaxID=1499967 RepID=A0A081C4A4_VECG1|nr:hypothetical protein U27_06393 [Candidatus Vecturithrix granuli]